MKIDKGNPFHWLLLLGFFLQGALGLILRAIRWRSRCAIILYGHKLNGNLLALYRHLKANPQHGLPPVFLTMDRGYHVELKSEGFDSCWASGFECAELLAAAPALISDHGLHSLQPLHKPYRRLGLHFFDVWHGIPFKGFDADDFRLQHHYDEIWVASKLCHELYLEKFGFDPARVVATGYARTDQLVLPLADGMALRASLGLPSDRRLILFAPTWKQDAKGRSLYPFGCTEEDFLNALADLAQRHDAAIVLRSHLNSGDVTGCRRANVYALPGMHHPNTESILLACDMLICDWSSIAFDFLLLDRPAFFLDVEPPFRKGFSLGPEYRYGSVIGSLRDLLSELQAALVDPDGYWRTSRAGHDDIKRRVYGDTADGSSSERCIQCLQERLRTR